MCNAGTGTGSSADVVDLTCEDDGDEISIERCGNYGKPIKVEWDGKFHDFIDGFGLCSPTRWKPRDRGHNRNKAMTSLALSTFQCLVEGVHEAVQDIRKEAFKLVTGKLQKSPFSEEMLMRVRAKLAAMLRDPADALVKDDGQPFYLRMLAQWLEAFEDPDVDCLVNADDSYATGVNVAMPGPAEVAAIVREAVEPKEAAFCVSADIKAAHRLVKIRQADWPYLCCRADSLSETVWINKTGTFGVSSAPFWWAKLFAAIGRFVGHLLMASDFWHMVYVDDLHGAFVGARKFEVLWVWLLAFEVIGTPFGYHKFKGGFSSDFAGFHLRYDRNEVGITTKRGTWLADWIRGLEEKKFVVAARDFKEFVGRLSFVAQLLVWLKPHLAPLFAWSAVSSAGLVGRLPDTVILTLKYILAEMGAESFMVSAKRPCYVEVEQFRTDAKCTDEVVVLGGWELSSRRWFSLRLTREDVPYLFKPDGGGSQWASTSAELLASLAALTAFGWLDVGTSRKTVPLSLRAGTDNLVNDLLSSKRTRWPLLLVNMQLSSSLSRARLSLDLRWRPREENIS
eukprot:s800_g2.t1